MNILVFVFIVFFVVLVICLLFFFFQAEDGIRDVAVTGVQTCALPILPSGDISVMPQAWSMYAPYFLSKCSMRVLGAAEPPMGMHRIDEMSHCGSFSRMRSEERRVGKECRSEGTA